MNIIVNRLITALLIIMLTGATQPIYSQEIPSDIPAQPTLKLPWPREISSTVTKTTTHDKPAIDFDFKNNVSGDYVLAAQDGTIVPTGFDEDYGDYVKIDHGNGYYTLYAHLATGTIRMRSGWVKQGQILGEVGCTGNCDGDHLHFELMYGSTRKWPVFTECNCTPELGKPYTSKNDIYSFIPGDFNRDGRVSILDYTVLFENYGWVGVPGGNPADINEDGSVDILDYTILFENFGESLYSSSRRSKLDLSYAAVPIPPSNVLFTSENNRFGTAVQVKLSWEDNSNDEDGFTFTWGIDGYASRAIIQPNETPPPPPGSGLVERDSASSNNTNSVVAILPCSEVS
ncbi:MAG: peptidoglycan DD-metalloendopeptidase family protein, partial [Candidatus Kariarchaeaceae archaeon]